MVKRIYVFFLGLMWVCTSSSIQGQSVVTKDKGRFSADINNVPVSDPFQLMNKFDLHLEWWTLLSEPMEYYDFTWYSTGKFVYGDRTITRSMLEAYPDLLKKFDRLEPYRVWITLTGDADGGVMNVKRGNSPNTEFDFRRLDSFKRKGQSYDRYALSAELIYEVDEVKILPSISGRKGKGIVPGSPHWNEFIMWGEDSYYQKGSRTDDALERANKGLFSRTQKIELQAQLKRVEWHKADIELIIDTYDKYQQGVLSPGEATDLDDLLAGNTDDFSNLTSNTKYEITYRDGKRGVVSEDGRILIPFKDWDIRSYDPATGFAEIYSPVDSWRDENECGISHRIVQVDIFTLGTVNGSGDYVIPPTKQAEISEPMGSLVLKGAYYYNLSEAEKEAEDIRDNRDRQRCSEWVDSKKAEFMSRLQSQGVKVHE